MGSEKRLIDANALIAEYDRVHIGQPGGARKLMEDAPTVDAVEVVHGQIEKVELVPNYMQKYRCSCCHSDAEQWYNYCSNCGAKMDLKGE